MKLVLVSRPQDCDLHDDYSRAMSAACMQTGLRDVQCIAGRYVHLLVHERP